MVLLLLLIVFSIQGECQAQDSKVDSIVVHTTGSVVLKDSASQIFKSPNGAMMRSMVFPGWGQWYNNKKFKALIAFCAETGLLVNAISLNQQLVKSSDFYEREFYINNRNVSVWWLVGVTLFSMADAFVDAHLASFDESPDLSSIRFKPTNMAGEAVVSMSLCFYF